MKCEVISPMKVKTNNGELQLQPGQIINLPSDKAIKPIYEGRIKPLEKVAYRIHSELLGDDLWLVESKESMTKLLSEGIKEPIYTHQEIGKLQRVSGERLKVIHNIKTLFPGSMII